mgnify:CR=1 FL=1
MARSATSVVSGDTLLATALRVAVTPRVVTAVVAVAVTAVEVPVPVPVATVVLARRLATLAEVSAT